MTVTVTVTPTATVTVTLARNRGGDGDCDGDGDRDGDGDCVGDAGLRTLASTCIGGTVRSGVGLGSDLRKPKKGSGS